MRRIDDEPYHHLSFVAMMPITSATTGASFRCLETYYLQRARLRNRDSSNALSTSALEHRQWECQSLPSSCASSRSLGNCNFEERECSSTLKTAIAHVLSIVKHKMPIYYCMPSVNVSSWIKSRLRRSQALQKICMKRSSRSPPLLRSLPMELIALAIEFLDGNCRLKIACVCKALCKETYVQEKIWKRLCLKKWQTLHLQDVEQLPEAPDYDIVRSYGGSWRRCYQQNHCFEQSTLFTIELHDFLNLSGERIISDTFSVLEHDFCLWVLPRGYSNEPQYVGQALSVYLVMTNLEKRKPGWSTCAIFTLSLVHSKDPRKNLKWHSNLIDNKLSAEIDNWGVHCLESLAMLKDPNSGYLHQEGDTRTLKIQAHVRIMTITFCVIFESDLTQHHDLGLLNFSSAISLQLAYCSTLQDLLDALQPHVPYNKKEALQQALQVWCCSQPLTPAMPMRPIKLLTTATSKREKPMFGSLLCDGTDIDAYSFCYLYVEDINSTSTKIAEVEPDDIGVQQVGFINAPSLIGSDTRDTLDKYVFMKALNATSHKLEFIGKFGWSSMTKLSTMMLCKRAAGILKCSWRVLEVYREEAAPRLLSGPLPLSDAQSDVLKASDIVIFALKTTTEERALLSVMEGLLWCHYEYAAKMLEDWSSHPSLRDIEDVMQYFQIPRYCVRNAYHKCHQNVRRTLKYIMEARQLGFACDKCGESDFLGPRYNCLVCHDYDECQACSEQTKLQSHETTIPNEHGCSAHRETHTMTKILPVFHNFVRTKSS